MLGDFLPDAIEVPRNETLARKPGSNKVFSVTLQNRVGVPSDFFSFSPLALQTEQLCQL